MLGLDSGSRAELVDLVLAQRDRLADLERPVARQREENATLRATIAQLTERVGELLAVAGGATPPDADAGAAASATEHVYLERRCPCRRRRWVPPPGLAGGVRG